MWTCVPAGLWSWIQCQSINGPGRRRKSARTGCVAPSCRLRGDCSRVAQAVQQPAYSGLIPARCLDGLANALGRGLPDDRDGGGRPHNPVELPPSSRTVLATGDDHHACREPEAGLEPRPATDGRQQGTPLVHNGVMFMPNPQDTIQAVDAVSGDLIDTSLASRGDLIFQHGRSHRRPRHRDGRAADRALSGGGLGALRALSGSAGTRRLLCPTVE